MIVWVFKLYVEWPVFFQLNKSSTLNVIQKQGNNI